jgi:hypothetical protein
MFCGVAGADLMVRVGPEAYDAALARPHARPMDFTGRPLTGYVYVARDGTRALRSLKVWIEQAFDHVATVKAKPRAKSKPRPFPKASPKRTTRR